MDPLEVDDPVVLGDYRLLARLGAGGMGRVFLARSSGGRTVALKVVRPELAEDGDFRRRFRREVDAAHVVGGDFTAPVVDADTDAGVPWLATSYVLGPSLERAIVEHGALPESGVRALAAGLVEALRAVHAAGLVHRDLKPANVMLAGAGPKVIDFGIARAVDGDRMTRTGLVVGSPGFMSPEQAESASIGPAGDVFSLGAVLTFAATGSGPFGDGSYAGLLYQVVHGEADLSQVPDSLRPILSACLAKAPEDRPELSTILQELAPEGALRVLTGSWLPAAVSSSIAVHAAEVMELDAPIRPAGTVISSSAVNGDEGERSQGHAPQTPAPPVDRESVASSDTPATIPRTPTVGADPVDTGGVSRRKMFTAGASVAGVALLGGGGAWALTRGDEPTSPKHPAAKSKKKHGASAAAPSQAPETTRPPGVAPQADWRKKISGLATSQPRVAHGVVLVRDEEHTLHAFDAERGTKLWSKEYTKSGGKQPAVVTGGHLLAVADKQLVAYRLQSGSRVWRYKPPKDDISLTEVLGTDGQTAYCVADDMSGSLEEAMDNDREVLVAVDLKNRKVSWKKSRKESFENGSYDLIPFSVAPSHVVHVSDKNVMTVRNSSNGKRIWSKQVSEGTAYIANPVISGETIYWAGQDMQALDLTTGNAHWTLKGKDTRGGFATPVKIHDTLYTANSGTLLSVDTKTGKEGWRVDSRVSADVNGIRLRGDLLYLASDEPTDGIQAFSKRTGKPKWNFRDGGNSEDTDSWQITLSGDRLYVALGDVLYALPAV